ncbi:MAG: TlpA family protein disulfide reductase [Oligoflexia bacterium]|nr:TlpA family protein disulfide reductase [Oligoflexia bacterium]
MFLIPCLRHTHLRISLSFLLCFLSACANRTATPPPSDGQSVSLELRDLRGDLHSLDDYSGKFVFIHFWASWCIPCTYELARLQRFAAALSGEKFTVLGIAVDDEADAVMDLVRHYRLSFPVLLDSHGETKQTFGLSGLPRSMLIGPSGSIVAILDPRTMQAAQFVDGARDWDKPDVIAAYRRFIQASKP